MKMYQKLKKSLLLPIALLLLALNASAQLTVTLTPSNVNCEGLRTGQITANVTGGVPPYQYKWSNGEYTQSISSLHGGYYHCYVVDANGSSVEKEITLTEPEELRIVQFDISAYANNYNTSCYNCNDGSITLQVVGGTPPYTYSWNDGSNLQNRTNLVARDYQVVVTDAFGCQVRELNMRVNKPESDDWGKSGSNSINSNNFIGSINPASLQFKAGNNLGFTLMPNADALFTGKIGIGTTTPTEKFEVVGGNAKFGGDATILGTLKLPAIASSTPTFLKLLSNGGVSTYSEYEFQELIYKTNTNCGNLNPDGSYDSPPNWGSLQFLSGYKNSLTTCGKVGINITLPGAEPTEALEVWGNSKIDGNSLVTGNCNIYGIIDATKYYKNGIEKEFSQWVSNNVFNSNNISFKTSYDPTNTLTIGSAMTADLHYSNAYIGFNAERNTSNNGFVSKTNGNGNGGSAIFGNSEGDLYFSCLPPTTANPGSTAQNTSDAQAAQSTVLELSKWGVLIKQPLTVSANTTINGTTVVNGNTLVNGVTHTNKVKVCATGWCDYVFEDDYKLTPLLEVEKYLQINKHLPNVPSATELVNNEVDLFEMQKIQMRKIEEMMLYIIELKKENTALKNLIISK